MTRRHATIESDLGPLLVVADGNAIAGLYFPQHWHPPIEGTIGASATVDRDPIFSRLDVELDEYLGGRRTTFDVAAVTSGDPFQEQVWRMLRGIPYGTTTTYGALAERLGDRRLARRIGGAVGRNPVSILIPCHRVVGASGSLTGYAGGLERKLRLLELEGAPVVPQRLF